MAQYLPDGPRTVMDLVDVDSAKFAQLSTSGRGPLASLYAREARLLGAVERDVAARASATLFVSEAEAALFPRGGGSGRVIAVENGIDAGVFDPAIFAPPSEPLVVMTGQMDYAPNVEGAVWLVERVLPVLREIHPDAEIAIVGRAPVPAVKALAQQPGVAVTGEVADVRPWLARAAVAAAPLHLARGIQNKVLEAMAMARPVVATSAAAEGIDHAGTLRTADDPAGFAQALAQLLSDRPAAGALGRAARARVLERYEWRANLAPLDALFA
jgi:sugar transferase (PEP-CTERM/EpsH1 system associated)